MPGTILITISYLIIVTLIIFLSKISQSKLLLLFAIPFTIWYSIALYFSIGSLLGYPTEADIPEDTIILAYRVILPEKEKDGAIYLWSLTRDKIGDKTFLPRSFSIPYDEKLHKQLSEYEQGNKKGKKFLIWKQFKKGSKIMSLFGNRRDRRSFGEFKIKNPEEIMVKDNDD